MSINFATLQGLTIPEGVVTQITDASGRVLWNCVREKTLYLRPSADISLEHPVYPTTLTSGYLAISEEVSDGATTYIGVTGVSDGVDHNYTSTFKMTLSTSDKIRSVISARFGISAVTDCANQDGASAECLCRVMVSGQEVFSSSKGNNYAQGENTHDWLTDADMPNFVTAVNEFISNNGVGVLPEIRVEVVNTLSPNINTKYTTSSYVSQLYIKLLCK